MCDVYKINNIGTRELWFYTSIRMSVICSNCRWVTIWYTLYSILYMDIAYIGKQLPRKCLWPILCVPIDTSRLIKPVSRRVFMRLSRCFFIILIAGTCETINRCVKKNVLNKTEHVTM